MGLEAELQRGSEAELYSFAEVQMRCKFVHFSERELTFTFAICYRPSVVCNVHAPYSAG